MISIVDVIDHRKASPKMPGYFIICPHCGHRQPASEDAGGDCCAKCGKEPWETKSVHRNTILDIKSTLLDISGATSTAYRCIDAILHRHDTDWAALRRQAQRIGNLAATILVELEVQDETQPRPTSCD